MSESFDMDVQNQDDYLQKLRQYKQQYSSEYGIERIGIFGSMARGEKTPESDLDVLVEAPVLSLLSLVGMKRRLEEIMGVSVDVVRKTEYMPLHFKARVEKEVIYA